MASERKHERFKKIAAARAEKINDMLRLLGNCANKGNYSYSDEEAEAIFSSIEENLLEAKQKYEIFRSRGRNNIFMAEFEKGFSWIEGFMRNVRRAPDKTALICADSGRIYTYAQANAQINKCANALLAAGVKRGDTILYQMGNCPEFVFIYAACKKVGAAGCPISMRVQPSRTASIIDFIKPAVFFYRDDGGIELAVNAAAHSPKLVVVNFPENKRALKNHATYEEFTDAETCEPPQVPADIYAESTLFYTSGTAGSQKCVPVTELNEVMSTQEVMRLLSINSDDIMLNLSRWAHRGGLHCCGPATALYSGAAVIAADEPSAAKCLEYIERYKITLISGSPPSFRALSLKQRKAEKNLASLKRVISVGSILSAEESLQIRRFLSPKVYNGYGTTETFINTILTPEKQQFFPGTAGTVCTDDEVRVVKIHETRDASPDELVPRDNVTHGEIIVKSCSKSAGYYKNNPTGGSRYNGGYLYTRDIGTWNGDGIITVVGRRDDMIVCGGEKIYPDEIESFLCRHPKIEDCIVTSVSGENGAEEIAAYVVRADSSLEAEEIDKYCRESRELDDNIRPRFYKFKKVLPKTHNEKKQHRKARQMASSDMKKGTFISVF